MSLIDDSLTDDAFLGGTLAILQPAKGYRAGLDAVLLAAATPVLAGQRARVLDAGAGVGVVGLAIAARVADANVTLVELEPEAAELARRNIARNSLDTRVCVVVADVASGGAVLHDPASDHGLRPAQFDHVVSNPPFYTTGAGTPPSTRGKAASHQMARNSLDGWMAFLATAAVASGTLTLIHRADALAQVLDAIGTRFGRIRILPVHSHSGQTAGRILVSAIKGSRAPLELLPGLVLHGPDGQYLPEIDTILRHGAPLPL